MSYQVAHSRRMSVDSDDTVLSVHELARGEVTQLTTWMDSRDHKTKKLKLAQLLYWAADCGNINICEAIIDSGHLSDEYLVQTLTLACAKASRISAAQLIVRRCRVSTQHLHNAFINCCTCGHAAIMQRLLSTIQMSHDERVTWRLVTASACGDINTVRLLVAHVKRDHTNVMSHALRTASYTGRVDVVDWLMTHTTADVSLRGEIKNAHDTMTTLAAACYRGHVDNVMTLLQCVTPHTVNLHCGDLNCSALHFTIWYTGPKWNSTFHDACARSNREKLGSLLNSADVNEQSVGGFTPLHWACRNDDKYVVEDLLSVFARIDITDDNRRTPIDTAKYYNHNNLLSCFKTNLHRFSNSDA